ncbi:MAG: helix-turn-helix transcriptional regulator [Rhodocyclaceae bacterium]
MPLPRAQKVASSVAGSRQETTNWSPTAVGIRLRQARKQLGLTQASLAASIGATSNRGIQENEAGKTMPGGLIIGALVRAGINANWLLSGQGPMLGTGESVAAQLDLGRMQLAIESTEEALDAACSEMPASKKAQLILAVYELLDEPGISAEKVQRLVRLAA